MLPDSTRCRWRVSNLAWIERLGTGDFEVGPYRMWYASKREVAWKFDYYYLFISLFTIISMTLLRTSKYLIINSLIDL